MINSIIAFEGFATFWWELGAGIGRPRVACFAWDPLAVCLPLPIIMLRQDVEALIGACFDNFAGPDDGNTGLRKIPTRIALDRLDGSR